MTRVMAQRIFPASCVLCEARGMAFCEPCRDEAMATLSFACSQCAIPLDAPPGSHDVAQLCGACLRRAPAFDATIAAATYDAPFDSLVRALKYRAQLSLAPVLAELVAARLAARIPQSKAGEAFDAAAIDVLIPVPLARERLAARGFNQALELARPLGKKLGLPIDAESVLRIRDTPPQAALPHDERRKNMRGAFAVRDGRRAALDGLCIGVVDDVMTTGATLDEFAATLKRAGAARVVNLVVARTP